MTGRSKSSAAVQVRATLKGPSRRVRPLVRFRHSETHPWAAHTAAGGPGLGQRFRRAVFSDRLVLVARFRVSFRITFLRFIGCPNVCHRPIVAWASGTSTRRGGAAPWKKPTNEVGSALGGRFFLSLLSVLISTLHLVGC
jgi:hypothetical protein